MATFQAIPSELDNIARSIVDSAFTVHAELGPGLLESVYEICLVHELKKREISLQRQVGLPISYDGIKFDAGFRLDLLVEDSIIVELKAVEKLLSVHEAQLLTYMKLSNRRLGLLINFNVPLIKDGIKRLVL